jgi:hypothetical protein
MKYATLVAALSLALGVVGEQWVIEDREAESVIAKKRRKYQADSSITPLPVVSLTEPTLALKGRFLHITDFHPDPHKLKKEEKGKGKEQAGLDGNEDSEPWEVEQASLKKGKGESAGRWGSGVS